MKDLPLKKTTHCRICKHQKLERILTLGPTPLANAFLHAKDLDTPEHYYPLDLLICKICTLVQLGHVVNPHILFNNYVYASSTSPTFVKHFEDFAGEVSKQYQLQKDDMVIDIGSNDGILLKPFDKLGMNVLGIEPAKNIAHLAIQSGIPTLTNFFNLSLAQQILRKHGHAKIITATNVFAHIDDLDTILEGVKLILDTNGVFIIEVPHLLELLKKNLFDTIYHEHLSYFSLRALIQLFDRFALKVTHVEKIPSHGGSLRVFVTNKKNKRSPSSSVNLVLQEEMKKNLSLVSTYKEFEIRLLSNKAKLLLLLARLKANGMKIAGYGAPAKGNTLLNFFNIGTETIDFIIDDSPLKQGLYTPGKRIPVLPQQAIYGKKPDYVLILAWNFAPAIIKMHTAYLAKGGKFIIPMPHPKICRNV